MTAARIFSRFVTLLLLTFAAATGAKAQGLGIGGLLNPEGSRLFPQSVIYLRHPGKPDPRWRTFEWNYSDFKEQGTEFRLYHYEEEEWAARLAAPRIRAQVKELSKVFGYVPSEKFNYVLFTSRRDFSQANIFFISEGVQGITSTTEATMAVPYWGHLDTFDHISLHEMVHQFQVQKINDLSGGQGAAAGAIFPLWFIEGMAEFYSQHGLDAETRFHMRDVILHPERDKQYALPKFFEMGPYSFVGVYKIGQAKVAFLDQAFGDGTAQRILEKASKAAKETPLTFQSVVLSHLGLSNADLERRWQEFVEKTFMSEAKKLTQTFRDYEKVESAGETLDLYDISPDGELLATREVDELTGQVSIRIIDLSGKDKRKLKATEDQQPSTLGLYFFEVPSLAITNDRVLYVVRTASGPELESRPITRDNQGKITLGPRSRASLHRHGLVGVSSPSVSPDGKSVAFVGLNASGWGNIYRIELPLKSDASDLKQLTTGYYGLKALDWGKSGIIASSNRTQDAKYNLFVVDPGNGTLNRLSVSKFDQLAPEASSDSIVYQSYESGSSQIYRLLSTKKVRLTDIQTGLSSPNLRGDWLYVLGFNGGRYRLYRIQSDKLLSIPEANDFPKNEPPEPWTAELAKLPEDEGGSYQPFVTSGTRLDYLSGFFGSGGVGGIFAGVSDLMRNYSITGEFSVLGDFEFTNAYTFLSSSQGRLSWTTGAYHVAQPRLDTLFFDNDKIRTYLYREYGAMAAIQYPLTTFSYFDIQLRAAGVKRTGFNDAEISEQFEAANPGNELLLAPLVRLGYDRVMYELFTGPLEGYGVLLEADTNWFPGRGGLSERVRLDGSYYFRLPGRTVFALRGVGGVSFGDDFRNPFFVSSDDLLRAYSWGDDRLFGTRLLGGIGELRFPIGSLFGFPPLRGMASYDIGTVYTRPEDFGRNIAAAASTGFSLNLAPLSINFYWSYPLRLAPGPKDTPVFHFTLRYLYL